MSIMKELLEEMDRFRCRLRYSADMKEDRCWQITHMFGSDAPCAGIVATGANEREVLEKAKAKGWKVR